MIRIERGEDINALRGMIDAGLISQDDLSKMTITGGLVSSRPQQFQGSRNGEEMQGQQQAKQPARKLRVIGYGNGQVTDLGDEDWKAPPLDYTRGGIEIAGVGKGHYSADGRAAYVQTPQGMTKVILGYDADASDRRNDAALKREMTRLQIEQEGLQNEGLRHRNEMLAAGPQQTMSDAPQGMLPVSKGQDAVDKAYAKDYLEWTQGGKADAEKSIAQLREVSNRLAGSDNISGAILGNIPHAIRSTFGSDSADVQDQVEEIVQRNLRLILGAQFTEKEGARLIARAYNPRLDESVNKARVDRLLKQIESAAAEKQSQADYYEQKGSLVGWRGKKFTIKDFEDAIDGAGQASPSKQFSIPDPSQFKVGQFYDTPKGRLMWVGNGWAK